MAIDNIGKKGAPGAPLPSGSGVEGPSRGASVGRPFEVPGNASVGTTGTQNAAPADAVQPPRTALERLRAGEIDVNGYVDLKVNEATTHLGALPAPELERVRLALRDRMAGDPTLVDLVRTATGSVPQPPTDE
jgi:hypothetical protein